MYEWRRYLAAVIALAMAGVLMLALIGMFMGLLESFTATIDRTRASLIIMPAKSTSMAGQFSPMPARVMPMIYRHPDVLEVRDLVGDFGPFYGPGADKPRMLNVNGVDTERNALTLPVDIPEDVRLALSVPYNIAVDRSALAALGVKLGDTGTFAGRTVRIAAIVDGYPNLEAPTAFISRTTLRLMGRVSDEQLGPLLVRLKPGADREKVRGELNAIADDQYRAWTTKALAKSTLDDVRKQGIFVLILGFMSTIGFVIGLVITWQTLRGAILANIKEFASLRALGVSIGSLRWVVMELSFWVGVAGVAASAGLLMLIRLAGAQFNVPMSYPLDSVIQTVMLLLLIAIGSGMLTLGALKKGQPADLLR
jgi:putative ABC transport system permease protein